MGTIIKYQGTVKNGFSDTDENLASKAHDCRLFSDKNSTKRFRYSTGFSIRFRRKKVIPVKKKP